MQTDLTAESDNGMTADFLSEKAAVGTAYDPASMKDKVASHKYSCYSHKCRKTFKNICQLLKHQKTHMKNGKPFACQV